ncbi:MAG: glycosyl hydrolase, partial [Acidobacteria bacterium]|nr:glycosyl hydrolase [Acidobacteriota bacterium]
LRIYADPAEIDTVYGLNVGNFKSTDGGKTFAGFSGTHSDNHDLWINPTNNKIIANANDGGGAITTDAGRTWSSQDNQPTAEIYRIETDRRWPFWVYGAQQDNSSVGVSTDGTTPYIGVGPGEAGYIAVDPRNPNVNYAGNYGGTLVRIDRTNGLNESVRIYYDSQTGQRASEMKYRQQWNAPIKLSPHNADIVYTTSQFVHRSKDGGQTWDVISPDLTRNDKTKMDFSGGSGITRDSTGVEVYCTVFQFEESPATPGLFWAGSDDGLLHISRDAGKTWQNITPTGLPEFSTINSIDLNAKLPGRAVVAAYRHMLNDYTPYIFLTTDFGKTWKRIADGKNGIPVGHSVRVVREDPNKTGVMFAGTEYGMYATFDEGAHWQRFQLNLPVTPIMDMRIVRNQLAIATEGRAFWVLDGLAVLQQLKAGMDAAAGTLFKPADAYRAGGPLPTIYYWLKEQPAAPLTIEIADAKGAVLFTGKGEPGAGPAAPAAAPAGGRGGRAGGGGGGGRGGGGGFAGPTNQVYAKAGLNKVTWNPNNAFPAPFTNPGGIVMWGGGGGGMKAPIGTYTVKITSGAWTQSQTFHLDSDPRFGKMTDLEGAEQLRLAQEVGGWLKSVWDNVVKMRDATAQAKAIAEKAGPGPVKAAADTFLSTLKEVHGELTQLQGQSGGQDSLNFPGRIDNQLVVLYGALASSERKTPKAMTERYTDLKPQVEKLLAASVKALTTGVANFNAVSGPANAGTITIK